MKKNIVFASLFFSISIFSQNINDTIVNDNLLDEFVVKAIRVNKTSPVAHENITSDELNKSNHGVDIPILLEGSISVVDRKSVV